MRQKIDIAEVESATKIRAKYLRALENEEFSLLPGNTFVKTFLRTYAEYLGLDSQLLVVEYRVDYEPRGETDLQPMVSRPSRRAERRRRPGPRGPPRPGRGGPARERPRGDPRHGDGGTHRAGPGPQRPVARRPPPRARDRPRPHHHLRRPSRGHGRPAALHGRHGDGPRHHERRPRPDRRRPHHA